MCVCVCVYVCVCVCVHVLSCRILFGRWGQCLYIRGCFDSEVEGVFLVLWVFTGVSGGGGGGGGVDVKTHM